MTSYLLEQSTCFYYTGLENLLVCHKYAKLVILMAVRVQIEKKHSDCKANRFDFIHL